MAAKPPLFATSENNSTTAPLFTEQNFGGADVIAGMGGADQISAGAGDDVVYAEAPIEDLSAYIAAAGVVEGGAAIEPGQWHSGSTLLGGAGDDLFDGGPGADMRGGKGNDRLEGGEGNDEYDYGLGDGHVDALAIAGVIQGEPSNAILRNVRHALHGRTKSSSAKNEGSWRQAA